MKRLLLLGVLGMLTTSYSQTTLFQDNFESGSGNWILNGGSGDNAWTVNNVYLGYPGLIPDTPNQPAGIANNPQSNYMHIVNGTVCSILGTCNANFDTGSASNQPSEMATGIDCSSYTGITVSFWYLCAGQNGTSYGTTEYSVDGGITWVPTGTTYHTTSTWVQETVTMPAWDNASSFKFRFRWQNGPGGLDPAFSVDDFLITGGSNCTPTTSSLSETVCNEYASPAGNTYTQTGTYYDTIPNAAGCDSIITIQLTVNTVDTGVTQVGETLVSAASSATYQWLDCDNNYAQIAGENGQIFIATMDGNYAVEVTQNGCTDTSACYAVTGLGVSDIEKNYLSVYPNPVSNELNIVSSSAILAVRIYNSLGQVVLTAEEQNINVTSLRRGVYFVDITTKDGLTTKRFVKK